MTSWTEFFSAEIGATATLAGLLFVSLSINISKILKFPTLPALAAQSLLVLIGSLLVLSLSLIPQPRQALGYELFVAGCCLWLLVNKSLLPTLNVPKEFRWQRMLNALQSQAATVPVMIAGGSLILSIEGAFYWLASATLVSIALATYNSWILLVEILR